MGGRGEIVHDWAKAQKISMSGWRLGTTSPMIRAGMPRRSIAARPEFAAPGASATSKPPDVCGSKSNARNSSATLSVNSTQLSTNSRLFFMPPEKKPAREASIAPGKYSMRSPAPCCSTTMPPLTCSPWPNPSQHEDGCRPVQSECNQAFSSYWLRGTRPRPTSRGAAWTS